MAKEQKESLIERISRAVDEGMSEEIDMEEINHRLFRGALSLAGRVKIKMDPMKKWENRP